MENNKKRNYKDKGRDSVDWISLTQENDRWQTFMNTVKNPSDFVKRWELLSIRLTVNFWKRILYMELPVINNMPLDTPSPATVKFHIIPTRVWRWDIEREDQHYWVVSTDIYVMRDK